MTTKEQVIELAKQAGASRYTNRHYPDRPTHTFTMEQLETYTKLVRNAALEDAKQLFSQPHQEYFGREAQDALESLKEPTP